MTYARNVVRGSSTAHACVPLCLPLGNLVLMVVYVAFIAILNLALGYALAVYLSGVRKRIVAPSAAYQDGAYSDDLHDEDCESDDSYEDVADENEYESAVR